MNDEEKSIMQAHISYWVGALCKRRHGGSNGTGVKSNRRLRRGRVRVASEEELNAVVAKDPANGLSTYEIHPMMAVTKY